MKKVMFLFVVAAMFAACNGSSEGTTTTTDSTAVTVDSTSVKADSVKVDSTGITPNLEVK